MSKENKKDIDPEDLDAAMDIVRGMSYEEIQELLKSNGLYKVILKMDEETDGIQKKIRLTKTGQSAIVEYDQKNSGFERIQSKKSSKKTH